MKKFKKTLRFPSLLLVLSIVLTSLTGCFDLGMFEDGEEEGYADYYAAFGDVVAVHQSGIEDYDIKESLFNASTVNDLDWEDEDDAVASLAYIYIAIPIERDMNVEMVSLYLKGETTSNLTISAYKLSSLSVIPSVICHYDDDPDDPPTKEGEDGEEETLEYQDPVESDAIATTDVALKKDAWSSISFNFRNEKKISAESGDVILLYIHNNTGYGRLRGLEMCKFTFLNLLIRAVEE